MRLRIPAVAIPMGAVIPAGLEVARFGSVDVSAPVVALIEVLPVPVPLKLLTNNNVPEGFTATQRPVVAVALYPDE